MAAVIVIEQDGQLQLPENLRKKLNLAKGDQLKVRVKGQKLILEKLKKRDMEFEETLAWAKEAASKLGTPITRQQLIEALKPEFMQKLTEKTQRRIEELGLTEAEIEQEILDECYNARHGKKSK